MWGLCKHSKERDWPMFWKPRTGHLVGELPVHGPSLPNPHPSGDESWPEGQAAHPTPTRHRYPLALPSSQGQVPARARKQGPISQHRERILLWIRKQVMCE